MQSGMHGFHPNFNLTQCECVLLGIGGFKVTQVEEVVQDTMWGFQPHVVYLELGTNDLCHSSPQ